jgi:uncharacterized membrane protein
MKTPTVVVSLWLLAMGAVGLLMPWFTRPDLFFGVTIAPEFRRTPPARRLLRLYRAAVCTVTVAAVTTFLTTQNLLTGSYGQNLLRAAYAALFVYLAGTCLLLVVAHHHAGQYATARASSIEVDLTTPAEHIPGGPLSIWLPFGWLFGLGLWAGFNPHRLPQRLIVHWGTHGPDRWVTTTPESVTALLALTAFLCLILTAMAVGVLNWSRRISAAGPAAASERQFRRQFVVLLLSFEYLVALLPAFTLLGAPQLALRVWSVALIGTMLVFVVRLVLAGQGGTHVASPTGAAPVGDRTDDTNWLGGLIYVNRADRAVLVEKRMGLGWTFNLGNPWAWALLAGVVAIPLVIRMVLPH